jgi:glycosyltransferase involved in cell wall biosynthesis
MQKPDGETAAKPRAFVLAPESPYPTRGGGALRTASLLEYLARRYAIDAAVFHVVGSPLPGFPASAAVRVEGVPLPLHTRTWPARAARNARRLLHGVPPLADRFGGCGARLAAILGGGCYELGLVEHFWCAPYLPLLERHCARLFLDLHNVESELHLTKAGAAPWPVSAMLRRFAGAYRRLEQDLLPRFAGILVTSPEDAARVRRIAPAARVFVYPNALPETPPPRIPPAHCIVFSGNLEYMPNADAVRYFRASIWTRLRDRFPDLEWRLVGMNPHAVARDTAGDPRIRLTGPVEDAVAALAEARVCVVPLRSGSGTRFKILEAWAAGRPVVSTSLGAEGLGARDGEHLRIADTPADFAAAVAGLLDSPEEAARLGANGRALLLERFTWPRAWETLAAAGL